MFTKAHINESKEMYLWNTL